VGRRLVAGAQKPFTVRTNWSQFHYGPQHQGFNPYENVLNPSNAEGLNQTWSYPTLGAIGTSSPAVANGLVYVGSYDGKLYALDASTGAYKWSYPTGSYINSSPAVANGLVYVGSTDNKLYALYASTGAKKWSYTTGGQIWSTSPAVANGLVYVGSTDHNLYALNAKTGDYLWSSQTADEILSSPAVADGRVYVGSIDNNLYAYSLDPGSAYVTIIRRPDPARLIPDDRLTPQVSKESPQAAQEEE
jgi:outer membrane protein assembly factor BamB